MERAIKIIEKRKAHHQARWEVFNEFGKQDQAAGDEDGASLYFGISQEHCDAIAELDFIIAELKKV